MKRDIRYKLTRLLTCYLPLMIVTMVTVFPFYWFLNTSLKEESSILKLPVRYIPSPFTAQNYRTMLAGIGFDRYFVNSLVVSGFTTLSVTVIAIMGGYAISRYKFKGKKTVFGLLLLTQMLPGVVILVPLFTIFNKLNLINNLMSLIIVNTTVNLPFCTIMISSFFSSVPPTLEEAAQIDGCSILKAVFKIVVPTILPGIIASGAFAFVNTWNEFVYSLNFINDSDMFTLPVGLSMMKGEFTVNYGGLAAGTVVALIPVLLIFCFIQKYLVQGLTAGAVKG